MPGLSIEEQIPLTSMRTFLRNRKMISSYKIMALELKTNFISLIEQKVNEAEASKCHAFEILYTLCALIWTTLNFKPL